MLIFLFAFVYANWLTCASVVADLSDAQVLSEAKKAFPQGMYTLFQGDSITDAGRDRRRKVKYLTYGQGYSYLIVSKLQSTYPEMDWKFTNHGISGDNIFNIQKRWGWDTLALKPDVISLLIGVNDIWQNLENNPVFNLNFTAFKEVYVSLLLEAKAQLPKATVVICEPFVLPGTHTADKWSIWSAAIKQMQAILSDVAAEHKLPIVHFQKVGNYV